MPNIPEYIEDSSTLKHYPPTGTVSTNNRGVYLISSVPAITELTTQCAVDGVTYADCSSNGPSPFPSTPSGLAVTDYVYGYPLSFPPVISGNLVLLDGTPCGTQNEFFNVHVAPTATLQDGSAITLFGPVPVNELGDYSLPYNASAATVLLKCQGSSVKVAIGSLNPTGVTDLGQVKMPGISAPVVSGMTATLGSTVVGTMLAPTTGQPSDTVPLSDAFLAEKGIDSRVNACQYYKARGATTSCSAAGDLIGPIDFDDWQQQVKIGKYATGATEYKATCINKQDLNLARAPLNFLRSRQHRRVRVQSPRAGDRQPDRYQHSHRQYCRWFRPGCLCGYGLHDAHWSERRKALHAFLYLRTQRSIAALGQPRHTQGEIVPGTCVVCHGGDKYAGHFGTWPMSEVTSCHTTPATLNSPPRLDSLRQLRKRPSIT